jgi:hypothetical protein
VSVLATTGETISTIASVVAAISAAVALYLARETVVEARKARAESALAHTKEAEENQHLLGAMIAARNATFHEGVEAFERELAVQRIVSLGSIANLLREAANLARSEMEAVPTYTPMPTVMMRLEVAVSLYRSLGGEADPKEPVTAAILSFATHSRGKGEARVRILAGANDLLAQINGLATYERETFVRLREHRVVREGLGQPDPPARPP